MADRVALSVQAGQDQQNNSVKHPETIWADCKDSDLVRQCLRYDRE